MLKGCTSAPLGCAGVDRVILEEVAIPVSPGSTHELDLTFVVLNERLVAVAGLPRTLSLPRGGGTRWGHLDLLTKGAKKLTAVSG